jgi:predicted RNase H-like nuclease (RuvC/YqgF family)
MKTRVSGVPYEVDLSGSEDVVSELNRENFMLHSRNQRLEDEVKLLDAQIARLTIEIANLKQRDRCPNHDVDDLK